MIEPRYRDFAPDDERAQYNRVESSSWRARLVMWAITIAGIALLMLAMGEG